MAYYSIDHCRESMVRILKGDPSETFPDRASTAGSGFIIRDDGYLITCHHVVYQLECLWVEYQDKPYKAKWCEEYSDPDVDIAILKIEVQQAIAVPIINPSQLETSVTIYGFPDKKYFSGGYPVSGQDIQLSTTLDVLETYQNKTVTGDRAWNILPQPRAKFLSHKIDTKVEPGTSGGAVIAEDLGGIVGIIQCSNKSGDRQSYCIRWDNITRQLEQLNLEPKQQVIRQFLEEIEEKVKYLRLFHVPQERILLQEQYIDIQVTLERKFRHEFETMRGYAESEMDNQRIYALKGMGQEKERTQVNWQEARKEHQRMVVLADPGMGKSTLLKQEALTVISRAKEQLEGNEKTEKIIITLLFRLSKLAESKKTILERIFELLKEEYGEQWDRWDRQVSFESLLREKLKAGTCLLLFDALDEVPKEQRLGLKERLNRFAKLCPCTIILTSRIVGYDGSFVNSGKDLEIVPFGREQTQKYIEYWFKNAEGHLQDETVSAEGLIAELEQKPQIQGLVQNPLLLSLLCSLYQTQGLILPARRTQVYQQAVNYILKDWSRENERKLQKKGWILAKIELLEFLAYRISCQNKEVFRLEDVRESLREYLEDGKAIDFQKVTIADLLEELTEEDGIIQKLSRDGNEYLFLHRTFQEYLTAAYLKSEIAKNQKQGIALVKEHLWEYDWHETISLVAGLLENPIPLLQSILREKDDIFKTLLLLAGSCIVECKSISHPLIDKIIARIGQFWRSYPNTEFIKSVLISLGKTDHLQVIELLIAALNDSDESVRWSAADALGNIGNERAVEALIAALNDSDKSVRRRAANALGNIGNERAVNALIAALNDSDGWVRKSAANALGNIGNERAVNALIAALNDSDGWVIIIRSAANALGKIGNERAVNALIAALNNSDKYVRRSAVEALGKIGNERAVNALIAALNDSDGSIRWSAANALGKIGNERAVNALIAALNDSDGNVRMSAANALGKMGNERAVEALIAALNDSYESVRMSAADALENIGNERAVNALIAALNDSYEYVRMRAAEALGNIGNERAVNALIAALNDSDRSVRMSAAEALGNIGNERAVEALIAALNDSDRNVRMRAAEALGNIGNERAVNALIAALNDSDGNVRMSAANALGKIDNPEILEKLIHNWQIDIYRYDIFPLARRFAVRYSRNNYPFIPVYPQFVRFSYSPLLAFTHRQLQRFKRFLKT